MSTYVLDATGAYVPPPDTTWTTVVSTDAQEYPYGSYKAEVSLLPHYCRIQLPLTQADSSGNTAAIIDVAQPIFRAELRIQASRTGKRPEMPDPDTSFTIDGVTYTLARHILTHVDQTPTMNRGTADSPGADLTEPDRYVYTISASYLYLCNKKPSGSTKVFMGIPRYTNLTQSDVSVAHSTLYASDVTR